MKTKRPSPKNFDTSDYKEIIKKLRPRMPTLEFERLSEPIVHISLKITRGLEGLKDALNLRVPPLIFLVSRKVGHTLPNTRVLCIPSIHHKKHKKEGFRNYVTKLRVYMWHYFK
jgi:hypothetical protein